MSYNNAKRRQMEDEMSRFEKEISGGQQQQNQQQQQQQQQQFKPRSMFIPHQLQRQQHRPHMQPPPNLMSLNQMPQMIPQMHPMQSNPQPFLPGQPNPHLINNHLIGQQPLPMNHQATFKPLIPQQFNLPPPPPQMHSNQPNSHQMPQATPSSQSQQTQQQSQQPQQQSNNNQTAKASYTVTPMGLPTNVHNVPDSKSAQTSNKKQKTGDDSNKSSKKQKKILRQAGGQVWEDPTLLEWDPKDFRIFCGDLGNDVNDDILTRAFNKYPSLLKCKVIRDKRTNKSKGYAFISFKEGPDFIKALREMNGKYVGSRPIKLKKSNWKDRNTEVVKKKMKEKQKLGLI